MTEVLKEFLALSAESPTGLVWLKDPRTKSGHGMRVGKPAFTAKQHGYYGGMLKG